ncbi:hypothetical protein JT305_24255 [Salmonella enterica subsp. enterica serovar Senftenberg]|nr:hypothetical protein [Salmonella enterica subsp. enterica serovar Senftenberg]
MIASGAAWFIRWRGNTQCRNAGGTDHVVYPAGAGNTDKFNLLVCQPGLSRWRGEHTLPYRTNQMMHGLSLARGTQPLVWRDKKIWFISLARGTRQHSIRNAGFNRFIRWRGEHVNWNIL